MSRPVESEPPNLPGLTFVRRLGRGGYAEVFLYEQANTHMRIAVKILFKEHLSDRTLEQFAAEANAMAELADHPYIVQVFQADVTSDGRPYLVMKYYPQRNLASRAKVEQLSVPEVLQIGVRITCAVETAHRAGILHRDIKPANILTSQYGEPGLTDFGIATKTTGGTEEESQGLSIPWSAPEVVFATCPGDRTADVYSLGATLWHLLGGHSPFEIPGGDNSHPAIMQRIREQPVPRTGREDVPASLERLLAQAMAKKPSERPQTALLLARSLQTIEAEERWALTPLVLLEEEKEARDDRFRPGDPPVDGGKDPATLRRPHSVVAQAAPTVAAVAATGPTPTAHARARVGIPAEQEQATMRKVTVANGAAPGSAAPSSAPPNVAPGRGRPERLRERMPTATEEVATIRRPKVAETAESSGPSLRPSLEVDTGSKVWKLAVASAVLVVIVVGTAFALSGRKAKAGSASIPPSPPPTLVLSGPLVSPIVTHTKLDPSHVQFTWTMAGTLPGDVFFWRTPSGAFQVATKNSVTLAVSDSQQACILVEVGRGLAYADSSVVCAG